MTTYNALTYPIKITQGDDWQYPLTFNTSLLGVKTPIDLTSATITGTVRPTYTTGTAVAMSVSVTNAALGQATLSLNDTQTSALPTGSLVYQVSITIAGNTRTYMSGNFVVKPKVFTV